MKFIRNLIHQYFITKHVQYHCLHVRVLCTYASKSTVGAFGGTYLAISRLYRELARVFE